MKDLKKVERIFPKEEVFTYGRKGIVELSKTLAEIAQNHDTNNPAVIVIPSRGVVSPIVHALGRMLYLASYGKDKATKGKYSSALSKISVPPVLEELLRFAEFKKKLNIEQLRENKKAVQLILLPFTADVNVEILKDLHGDLEIPSNEEIKKHIRRGGVRVLKALFKEPNEREPYFHTFINILELEGRKDVADYYRKLRLDENARVYIVDTVISGTAASHIYDALREEGLSAVPILLVDKNGSKLKGEKRKKLRSWVYAEGGRMIMVPTLPAEDRGVGFLGVAALVYPQIGIYLLRKGEKYYPTLFGTWVPVTQANKGYQELFKNFSKLVLVAALCTQKDRDKYEKAYKEFAHTVLNYRPLALHYGITSPKDLADEIPVLAKRGILLDPKSISHVHETSARVAHIFYKPHILEKIMRMIVRKL